VPQNGQLRPIDNDRSEPLLGTSRARRVSAVAMIRRHGTNQDAWPVVRSERPRGAEADSERPPGPPRMWSSSPDVEGRNSYGHLAQGKQAAHTRQSIYDESRVSLSCVKGEVGFAMTIVSLPARGRP
jgi:hypothetical protein